MPLVAAVGVEALLHGLRRHFQRALAVADLQRLEVDRVGVAGSYEAGEFGFDGGGELLRAGFFPVPGVPLPLRCKRASASCSLISRSPAVRRRKRWYSSS